MHPAPFHEDLAQGPKGGSAYWLETEDGTRIRMGVWPKGDRGTVLIFPGRSECIEKYGRVAAEFAKLGFAVAAIDWRGQGLADRATQQRKVGHVSKFSDFQLDVAAVRKALTVFRMPTPMYLVAHSMGGCIGLRALHNGLDVKKAMFSAPMWGITFTPTVLRPVAWTVSTLLNPFGTRTMLAPGAEAEAYLVEGPFEDNTLTTDPDTYDYMRRQVVDVPDFRLGGPSVAWLHSALREMRTLSKMDMPDYPCITYLGTDERIVDPARIKDGMAKWKNGELVEIEGARHEILMETPETREKFYTKADAFFN